MLEVGNGGMTDAEYREPLRAVGDDERAADRRQRPVRPNMTAATKAILTNKDVIAINQDAFGLQGVRIWQNGTQSLWGKPLNANGARAALLFNEGADAADMTLKFADLGLAPGSATVRDLQGHTDLGSFKDSFTVNVASHGTATLKIVGNEPPRPKTSAYLSDYTPIYAANGLGPVERDTNNGATAAGDGTAISIRGQTFTKGLGTAAPSAVIYRLGGKCSRFTATAGVDDATNGAGTRPLPGDRRRRASCSTA